MPGSTVRLHAPLAGARVTTAALDELAADGGSAPGPEAELVAELQRKHAQLDALLERLAGATGELQSTHERLQEELPAFAIRLGVGIAQELVRRELNTGNYDIEAIVRSVLATADTGRSACTIHLHPDDMEAIDTSRFRSNTRFESDPDIARGDVHVTTPQGLLVRDVDATLVRIREELLEASR